MGHDKNDVTIIIWMYLIQGLIIVCKSNMYEFLHYRALMLDTVQRTLHRSHTHLQEVMYRK